MGKKFYSSYSKTKYYAVKKGRTPGIYYTWEECKAQIHKFSGAVFKSFEDYEEAEEYMNNNNIYDKEKNSVNKYQLKDTPYAYISGYFNHMTQYYGYDGYIYYNDKKYIIQGYDNNYKYMEMKNIAGQILGCKAAIEKAIELGIKNIDYIYDYEGIKMWATGKWKRNKYGTIEFYEYIQSIKSKININFIKNDKHNNNFSNDIDNKEIVFNNNNFYQKSQEDQSENIEFDENESEKEIKEKDLENNIQKDYNIIKRIKIDRMKKSINEKSYLNFKNKNENLLKKRKIYNGLIKNYVFTIDSFI